MNRVHLGDAYDYVKRVILETLTFNERKITVVPMITKYQFDLDEVKYYAAITCISTENLNNTVFSFENRVRYFEEVANERDVIFVDPDNGVIINASRKKMNSRITLEEILTLSLKAKLLIIYDQSFSRNEDKRKSMIYKLKQLEAKDISGFYVDLQASFVFISKYGAELKRCEELLLSKNIILPNRIQRVE